MLMRLNVAEVTSGTALYEKIWKWKGDHKDENISRLIQVFFQFARDISGDNEISHIVFGEDGRLASSAALSHSSTPNPPPRRAIASAGGRDFQHRVTPHSSPSPDVMAAASAAAAASSEQRQIFMVCRKSMDGPIMASLFYDSENDAHRAKTALAQVMVAFQKEYATLLETLKPVFIDMQDELSDASLTSAHRQQFKLFDVTLQSILDHSRPSLTLSSSGRSSAAAAAAAAAVPATPPASSPASLS